MGTEAGEFRARRRWLSSSRQGPGGGKGALEDREGVSAGALAAAYTLGGGEFLDLWSCGFLVPVGFFFFRIPEFSQLMGLSLK